MNSRRMFLATGLVGVGGVALFGNPVIAQDEEKPKPIQSELVNKFVGRSHGDFETVKAMVKAQPEIVNATWDWGNGDFETGLGAASHVGRRNIAEFLLENGARLDIFAATMLGIKPIVSESLKAFPKIHSVRGPHQIPLLIHAIFGREQADEVFELLLESGADVNAASKIKMTPLMAAAMTGRAKVVESLLSKGADLTATNDKGETALEIAKNREKLEAVKVLESFQKK